jgi:hypothetical protein
MMFVLRQYLWQLVLFYIHVFFFLFQGHKYRQPLAVKNCFQQTGV